MEKETKEQEAESDFSREVGGIITQELELLFTALMGKKISITMAIGNLELAKFRITARCNEFAEKTAGCHD